MNRYWCIRGMNSLKQVSETMIPEGHITIQKLEALLQTLVAKHGLSDDEIVSCFYRKNCKKHRSLLEVRYDKANNTRECGCNPYYVASLVDENGDIVHDPVLKRRFNSQVQPVG